MSEALKSVGAITLFVEDLPAARSFYERVFGRTAAFEDDSSAAFKFDNTLINLVDTRAAGQVIAPVAVASPSAGSRFLLTIWVDDVDAACAELANQGVGLLNGLAVVNDFGSGLGFQFLGVDQGLVGAMI